MRPPASERLQQLLQLEEEQKKKFNPVDRVSSGSGARAHALWRASQLKNPYQLTVDCEASE